MHPSLVSPAEEGHGSARASPEEAHEDDQRAAAPLLRKQAEGIEAVQPEEEKV